MLCVVAFVVVLVLSAVSARYRRLLGRAWGCAWRRVTFRPCDTTFRDDVKSSMLAPVATRAPRLVAPASVAIEVVAWLMVVSLIVSLFILGRSGLNLFVYGTCDKQDAQSCSLAAEMCSIDAGPIGFWDSVGSGDLVGAFGNEFASLGETIAAVPSRLRSWDAADYAAPDATYLGGYEAGRPTAIEIIDPGCRFCAQLFRNMRASGFDRTHNVTYLVYPIASDTGPRFANSPLVASYLTALRAVEAQAGPPEVTEATDWVILETLFSEKNADGTPWQVWMNAATTGEARTQLHAWLEEAGYDDDGVAEIAALAASPQTAATLAAARTTVEDEIQTLAIPSLIAGGRLRSGLVDVDTLRGID